MHDSYSTEERVSLALWFMAIDPDSQESKEAYEFLSQENPEVSRLLAKVFLEELQQANGPDAISQQAEIILKLMELPHHIQYTTSIVDELVMLLPSEKNGKAAATLLAANSKTGCRGLTAGLKTQEPTIVNNSLVGANAAVARMSKDNTGLAEAVVHLASHVREYLFNVDQGLKEKAWEFVEGLFNKLTLFSGTPLYKRLLDSLRPALGEIKESLRGYGTRFNPEDDFDLEQMLKEMTFFVIVSRDQACHYLPGFLDVKGLPGSPAYARWEAAIAKLSLYRSGNDIEFIRHCLSPRSKLSRRQGIVRAIGKMGEDALPLISPLVDLMLEPLYLNMEDPNSPPRSGEELLLDVIRTLAEVMPPKHDRRDTVVAHIRGLINPTEEPLTVLTVAKAALKLGEDGENVVLSVFDVVTPEWKPHEEELYSFLLGVDWKDGSSLQQIFEQEDTYKVLLATNFLIMTEHEALLRFIVRASADSGATIKWAIDKVLRSIPDEKVGYMLALV